MRNNHDLLAGSGQGGQDQASIASRLDAPGLPRASRCQQTRDQAQGIAAREAADPTHLARKTESAARVSTQRVGSPPAKAADFRYGPRRWAVARTACVVTALVAVALTGCSTGPDNTGASASEGSAAVSAPRNSGGADRIPVKEGAAAAEHRTEQRSKDSEQTLKVAGKPSASAQAGAPVSPTTAADLQPRPDSGDKAPTQTDPVVGFEPEETGAPAVNRGVGLQRENPVTAMPGDFGGVVSYPDGVQVTTGKFRRGSVTEEGPGYITGAKYLVMDVKIKAPAKAGLNVDHVVATLRFGDEELVGAPLYGEADTRDFGGTIKAKRTQTAIYAFLLPDGAEAPALYVDIDGQHAPATVRGALP